MIIHVGEKIIMLTQYVNLNKKCLNGTNFYVNTLLHHVNVLTVLKYVNSPL